MPQPMFIQTSRSSYRTGDTVKLTGNVGTVVAGQPVLIQIFTPVEPYKYAHATVGPDGSYTYSFIIGGFRGIAGTYRAVASYTGQPQAETSFQFITTFLTALKPYELKIGSRMYQLRYAITGGDIAYISLNIVVPSLRVSIDSQSDGTLFLKIPRTLIDCKDRGRDEPFAIIIDKTK